MKKHEQLNLFTQKLKFAFMVAGDSPRRAFYRIWIEQGMDDIKIVKESGIKGRVLDRRAWHSKDLQEAQKVFDQKVRAKTNPDRKSPRKYRLINDS